MGFITDGIFQLQRGDQSLSSLGDRLKTDGAVRILRIDKGEIILTDQETLPFESGEQGFTLLLSDEPVGLKIREAANPPLELPSPVAHFSAWLSFLFILAINSFNFWIERSTLLRSSIYSLRSLKISFLFFF